MKSKWILFFILAVPLISTAYVPRYEMIMERVGRNHGYGFFLIDQEVIFPAQPTPYIVKEQWMINTDGSYRLRVKGERQLLDKLDITIVYNGRRKHYINAQGVRKTTNVGSEFADPLFWNSNPDKLTSLLKQYQVQIPDYKSLERVVNADTNAPLNPGRSATLNLSRIGGRLAYAVGAVTEFGNSEKDPAIWIEQDQFNILKFRMPSQTEITASDYSRYSRGMHFPKERKIQTPTATFQINLRQVKAISSSSGNKRLLSVSSLDPKKSPHVILKLPDIDIIKSFYQRFR